MSKINCLSDTTEKKEKSEQKSEKYQDTEKAWQN